MTVTLLGPQRFHPTVGEVVRSVARRGAVATVTAGAREREPDDAELDGLLDGRSTNLALYGRQLDVYARDPELAGGERRRRDVLAELRDVYLLRLHYGMEAVYAVQRRDSSAGAHADALTDAVEAVKALDARHLALVGEVHAEFHATWPLHERPAVAEHRAAVADLLSDAAAVAVAGGHVDVLLACLHLFNVASALASRPVVAWSAGAMAMTERVLLFHDRAPQGPSHAELYDVGLGLCRGAVVLPHARRRLLLDQRGRMAVLARRLAPARCVILDDGVRVDCTDDGRCRPAGTRVLSTDGRVATLEAA